MTRRAHSQSNNHAMLPARWNPRSPVKISLFIMFFHFEVAVGWMSPTSLSSLPLPFVLCHFLFWVLFTKSFPLVGDSYLYLLLLLRSVLSALRRIPDGEIYDQAPRQENPTPQCTDTVPAATRKYHILA